MCNSESPMDAQVNNNNQKATFVNRLEKQTVWSYIYNSAYARLSPLRGRSQDGIPRVRHLLREVAVR